MESWEGAPAPALVAKQLLERVIRREVPPRYTRLLNNITHWGFGLTAGAGYGLLVGSRKSKVRYGLPFGAATAAAFSLLDRTSTGGDRSSLVSTDQRRSR